MASLLLLARAIRMVRQPVGLAAWFGRSRSYPNSVNYLRIEIMQDKKNAVSYLYINGLGDGRSSLLDIIIDTWWRFKGKRLERFSVNWYSARNIDDLTSAVVRKIELLSNKSSHVVVIGSSAGGSLAINALCTSNKRNLYAVVSRGRLKRGIFRPSDTSSLENRSRKSKAFHDSVIKAEHNINQIKKKKKKRILLLLPLTDRIVPIDTMLIDGVTTHTSIAFGHYGGYLAHMIADIALMEKVVQRH